MNYPLKSSNLTERRRSGRRRLLALTLLVGLALALLSWGPVRQFFFSLATPLWRLEHSLSQSNFFQYFKFKRTLIEDKQLLEQKLFLAGHLLAENQILQAENETLKELLGRKEIKGPTVLAAVLVKPPITPYDELIVDVGTNLGAKVGDKVMAQGNVYLGEVSAVYGQTAKVNLYSTPGRKLAVALGADSIRVEAVGMGGGNFSIFLPREVEVKEGDVIVIPAITPNVFGIVEKVNFRDKDSFQTILFKSPVNISEVNLVEIIL